MVKHSRRKAYFYIVFGAQLEKYNKEKAAMQ